MHTDYDYSACFPCVVINNHTGYSCLLHKQPILSLHSIIIVIYSEHAVSIAAVDTNFHIRLDK